MTRFDPRPVRYYLDVLAEQAALLADEALEAGPDAPVPSCPDWEVRDLLSHLGTVHRWATAHVLGHPVDKQAADVVPGEAELADTDALVDWFRTGSTELVAALGAAPADLRASVFLADPPDPLTFWARRQAHETTIHRVDGTSARLGRLPTATEAAVDQELALDGVDELLLGFLPRPRTRLRSEHPFSVTVAPAGTELAWTILVSGEQPQSRPAGDEHADVVLTGRPDALYLGLWNRGDEIAQTGSVDALGVWRSTMRISWS